MKKLVLKKVVLRDLDDAVLESLAGGSQTPPCSMACTSAGGGCLETMPTQ